MLDWLRAAWGWDHYPCCQLQPPGPEARGQQDGSEMGAYDQPPGP